jgi:hypothetical protein
VPEGIFSSLYQKTSTGATNIFSRPGNSQKVYCKLQKDSLPTGKKYAMMRKNNWESLLRR